MNAYLIIIVAVGFLAGALLWAAHTINVAARWRQRDLEQLRRQTDLSWARTLQHLETENARRRYAGGKVRRVK